jgi:hypothetical protein
MTYTDLHEAEEADYARGDVLWDATPGVCCAAFQLGACAHTEAYDLDEDEAAELDAVALSYQVDAPTVLEDEPF